MNKENFIVKKEKLIEDIKKYLRLGSCPHETSEMKKEIEKSMIGKEKIWICSVYVLSGVSTRQEKLLT